MNVEEEDVFQPAPEDVIQDWMLNWVIRGVTLDQSYKKEDYKPITPERFEGLKQFTFSAGTHPEAYPETLDIYVHSLEGLQYGKDLYKIDLSYNKIKDLSPLSKLTNLGDLRFYMNELTTLKPLSGLVNLERLNCGYNTISDLTPLKKMSKLKYLAMESNNITTLNGLEGCTSLQETFTIIPKGTQVKSLKAAKKSFKATWARQKTQVSGYQLQYARNKSFKSSVKTSTISNNKTVSKTVTKLTAKKTYYVRVRTYKNVKVNGKTMKLYSGWSTVKKTTVK